MPAVSRETRTRRPRAVQQPDGRPVTAELLTTKKPTGILSGITRDAKARPFSLLMYGEPGIGKTEMMAHAEKSLFLIPPQEQGIVDLKARGTAPESVAYLIVRDWKETTNALAALADDNQGYDWLVLDSMTWFEHFCWAEACKEEFNNDWSSEGFLSYARGPVIASERNTYWPYFIKLLDDIRDGSGMNVCCLCHSTTKNRPNPEGPNFLTFQPKLHERSFEKLHIWAQGIYFMNYYASVTKDGTAYKADAGSESRYIYTSHTPIWDAKDRLGLSPMIDMGNSGAEAWSNFQKELRKAKR